MERERFLTNDMNWNYSNFGMEIQSNDFNNNNSCIFNPKWDNSMDQSDPFESAVSSIVSSPAASNGGGGPTTTTPITGDSIMIRELIGRLGSICNSGEISPQPYIPGNNSTNTSCYNTPLNSPPKLNLSMMDPQMRPNLPLSGTHLAPFPADPGFAERAARFSCFGTRNVGQFSLVETELGCCNNRSMPKSESGKLSRVSSNQSFKFATGSGSQMGNLESNAKGEENGVELNDSREGSSVSEQVTFGELNIKTEPVPPAAACNNRKRKSITKGKGKEAATNPKDVKAGVESDELKAKRSKQEAENGTEKGSEKGEECCDGENKNGGEGNDNQKTCNYKDNLKPPEPPKDYIHVRARRGQATDSHSLAERVRREKISERMKFLQDLVPGCNKVIGKAVMLDEIINYVQSLQRQVEFLSMKLATVNPRMDFNMETLLPKEVFQTRGSLPQTMYPLDSSMPGFSNNYQALQLPSPQLHNNGISTGNENQFSVNPAMSGTLRRNLSTHGPPPVDGFAEAVPSQVSSFWEDDLQSVVQMGYGQN